MTGIEIATLMFWSSAALVAYSYLLYPPLIWVLSRWFGLEQSQPELPDESLPTLSLLIACHNEEAVVEDRLKNALVMDYPREKLEIVVGCDGCSDRTQEIVRGFASSGVRLEDYPVRRGKASVLNDSISRLQGDVVILSDANTDIHPLAARRLARWFQDSEVGVVVGKLQLIDPSAGTNPDGVYWKYENFLKEQEAKLGGLLGANGAIYAIRRGKYIPIARETIIDDFVIPLLMKLTSGCKLVYDRDATATEETAPDVAAEFRRRVRIGAGGFQSLARLHGLLNPGRGWVAFTFFSHKVLRWLCPFFLLVMISSSAAGACLGSPFHVCLLFGQILFYGLALAPDGYRYRLRSTTSIKVARMFTFMNLALLFGFWRWLSGTQRAAWQRTPRLSKPGVA